MLINVAHANESRQPAETELKRLIKPHVALDQAPTGDELNRLDRQVSIVGHF